MEHENDFASKGVAGAGLGIAIGAGVLALLGNGGLGNLFGVRNAAGCDGTTVSHYEQQQAARIAALETEVKLRDSNIYTDGKILDLYKYVDGRLAGVERELSDQRVYNATMNGAVSCIQAQIAQLQALTKVVIPNTSVCPGWGNVTVAPASAATT